MEKKDKAVELFNSGYNCAQSVVTVFADNFGLDPKLIQNVSRGFGGGMGRQQETCGAVTGAYMVLGLKYGNDESNSTPTTYNAVKEFSKKFSGIHHSTTCKDLIKCDLNTEAGQQYFKDNKLKEKICSECIRNAVNILESM